MTQTLENAASEASQFYAELQKDLVDSSNLTEQIEQTFCNMSATDLRSYFGYAPKENVGKAKSATRKKKVAGFMEEFKANIKYNIDAAINTHMEKLKNIMSTADLKSTEIELTQLQSEMYDSLSPHINNLIFTEFIQNKLKSESEFYKFMEKRVPILLSPYFASHVPLIRHFASLKSNALCTDTEVSHVGKMEIPQILTKTLSLNEIPSYESDSDKDLMAIVMKLLLPRLEFIMFPCTVKELRSVRNWKGLNIRFINYAIALVIYGRYLEHPEFPSDLKHETFPPPWFVVTKFFYQFGLPGYASGKGSLKEEKSSNKGLEENTGNTHTQTESVQNADAQEHISQLEVSPVPKELCERIVSEYKQLHLMLLTYGQVQFHSVKNPPHKKDDSFKLEHLDCVVRLDCKRPPRFTDLTDFIYKYREAFKSGKYDEYSFMSKSRVDIEILKNIAKNGLHYNEIAILETVFKADPHSRRPRNKEK
ncbi:predicted protein [Chaetoceros tenuissimus]|uniref:Uncharacterized protein n=1 Tax=Chaetoceros tenuissimus TaxID=426638 RepID=A0AAD3HB06_9STRA|nr:predicted protein [Chaetoceros tenuissimus]